MTDLFSQAEGSISLPCIPVEQPIGTFYICSIDHRTLCQITRSDVRRMEGERGFEAYLGIQRPLNKKRATEIAAYTNTVDACFPTAIIISVPAECAEINDAGDTLTLKSFKAERDSFFDTIHYDEIAKVIDGQHRIAGLEGYEGDTFNINVSVFIDIDVSTEANIFSTVNLAQTKVSRSLAYDLFALAKKRSPQKLCHQIAVVLDSNEDSPFYNRIKRLGVAEPHNLPGSITQAAFVSALMKYISDDPIKDRDMYMRGFKPKRSANRKLIFRDFLIDERDAELAKLIWNYFAAVMDRWPAAWNAPDKGIMLSKTNGFMALMRFLKDCMEIVAVSNPSKQDFYRVFEKVEMTDSDFNTTDFKPGSSGESALYRKLKESVS